MTGSRKRAHLRGFLRSFTIQGSWNYRTMLGAGFAYCILPTLRSLYGTRPEAYRAALQRHAEHFNAHPYLSAVALGAVCKMEEEGRSAEEVRRFKVAVRGPLGGLGDALIWVGWRPMVVLAALVLAAAGAPPAVVVGLFIVAYNLGHLTLRIWGFRVGLEQGSRVGDSLRFLALPRQADRLAGAGVFLLGALGGLAAGWALQEGGQGLVWVALAGLGMWVGSLMGPKSWRWTLWGMTGVIGGVFLLGWFG